MSQDQRALLARMEGLLAEIDRDTRAAQRQHSESEQQREQAARTGEMGPDWQRIQRRIDAGETSLREVFSGADDSPEARRLVGYARANAERIADDLPDEVQPQLDETQQQWEQLRERPGR